MWVVFGSKHIHAITRCQALVPNVSTLVCTPLSLHTSEWAFDQSFCYFPKDNFIFGHPVEIAFYN